RGRVRGRSVDGHRFGSPSGALAGAGLEVGGGEEGLERAIARGAALARRLGRLPKFADWVEARKTATEPMLTEWQVYRLFDAGRGAWAAFPFLVRERLRGQGGAVASDGTLT